jgi:hypothetical protein
VKKRPARRTRAGAALFDVIVEVCEEQKRLLLDDLLRRHRS